MLGGIVRRHLLVFVLAGSALLAGCDNYDADINAVKQAETLPGRSNDELVMDLAGARASVEWTAAKAEQYDNADIVAVTATINRIGQGGQRNVVDLIYIHNRQTKKVAFEELRFNGKRQDLFTGALNLLLLEQFKLQLQ